MNTTLAMKWMKGMMLSGALLTGAACSSPSENNAKQDPGPCEEVTVDGGEFCVWHGQNIIIETGYTCPSNYSYRYDFSGQSSYQDVIVCSRVQTRPTSRVIYDIRDLLGLAQLPLDTDMGTGDMPATGRTCDDIRADFGAAYGALPSSCATTSDCRYAGVNSCGLADQVMGGCDIAVSQNADTSALDALAQEYQALGCQAEDPACNACPAGIVACEQGACVTVEDPANFQCEYTAQLHDRALAEADRSCSQDSDCVVRTEVCLIGPSECASAAISASADMQALDAHSADYSSFGCADSADCISCEETEAKCDQGQCVAVAPTTARTCNDVSADYKATQASSDRSCAMDSDCQVVEGDCHMSLSGERCSFALNSAASTDPLTALSNEYDALGCRATQGACMACEASEPKCDQGQCVAAPVAARTCDDIRADYAAVYASFPTTCSVAADCESAGINPCGLADQVVDGCTVAISANADKSPLNALAQEYQALGCQVGDPICNACAPSTVSCVQGQCVGTN